jgi:hypothetical protein
MTNKMLRPSQIYGKGNWIPCGKTKFFEDIVLKDESDPYIPGTKVRRLRLTTLGERVSVGFEDEVRALAEAIRQERDAKLNEKEAA